MSLGLYAFQTGTTTVPQSFLRDGASRDPVTVPILSVLVVHERGTVVFDTGLNPLVRDDLPAYFSAAGLAEIGVDLPRGHSVAERLAELGRAPESIDFVVNSHLHYDHCGGNALLPEAEILIQRAEWDHATRVPDTHRGYRQVDFASSRQVTLLDGRYDVFGDGSVVCVPTHGHTPGHQSLVVRGPGRDVVLCGDACYTKDNLDGLRMAGIVADRAAALASLAMLRDLRAAGALVVYGHEPGCWDDLPHAPRPVF
ncbi:N-acyl homoserine lactonase family protein [Amycolatopsis jejuensis]|uniref:N-acyl homoserine lactonase family protein n=1 Tax=Amycolatopsis jejuensis TaxID=330084 RepID=UPI00068F03B9|nr:N-acyl homoserine lactonase family protein [Amycolatopsis jejuensis]